MLPLTVNGTPRHTSADPGTLLVSVLRDDLRLTGTKVGCDDGRCGSCTVLVNGRVARSCVVTAGEVSGRDILTVEGLGAPEALHPVQRAFVEAGAVQCGFCTPGLLMATIALLEADPRPERDVVVRALGANYCRCTGYGTIFDAVDRAAALRNGDAVGPAPLPLDEAWSEIDMVTGRAMFGADLHKDGMLHLTIVRSPHPHARILAVHTGEARALPGVEAVFTSADVPVNRHGRVIQDQAVLAAKKVRMIGDPIAAVVATSEATLRLNRPVRCVYTREESFATTTKRHAFEIDATLGADRDGRVTGLRMEMLADGGAYASAGTAMIVRAAVSGCGALTRSVAPSTVI